MTAIFAASFMRTALLAGLAIGAVCAYMGAHALLRRIVFVGAALAQVSSAGVGLALLTGLNPSLMTLLLTLGGVAAFSVQSRERRTAQENLIDIGYAVASALAVLFVAKSSQSEAHLIDVLSGSILTVDPVQLWWAAGLCVLAVVLHALFHRQFLFCAFDPDTAQTSGFKVVWWDLFLFLLLGVVVALSIRLAGTLLVFGFLVSPALTGLALSRHLTRIYLIAIGSARSPPSLAYTSPSTWTCPPTRPSSPAASSCCSWRGALRS